MAAQSGFTRREALVGALGIPLIVREGVIGRRGRPGANDRIVIANIGVGGMGRNHVPADTAALCDVDDNMVKATLDSVRQRNATANPATYRDYRRVLERKDIDAVTIGTPDHWHALMTIHACQAGKHVYSEKPTARTIAEGRAMVNAARRNNRIVQIGAQGRSNPNARAACQYIRAGMLGKVNRVEIWHPDNPVTPSPCVQMEPPSTLNWELWLGPAKWRPFHSHLHPAHFRWVMDLGGGQIRDRGNHALSMVSWLMDMDGYRGVVTCEARGEKQTQGCFDVPLKLDVTWQFRNPDWTLLWHQGEVPKTHAPWGATYFGDRDSLIVTQGDNACNTEDKAKLFQPSASQEVYLHPTDPKLSATERHRENWLDCIRTGKRPAMDVEIGHRTVTLCNLANIAFLLGRKITLDVRKERFVRDSEADRFIDQPMRSPWHL